MDSVTRCFASGFFHESSSPSPSVYHKGRFEFFRKFAEIFASEGAPTVSTTRWQIFCTLSPVPLVLLMPVANNAWQQDQTADRLKVNLKGKIYPCVNSNTQSCSKKIIKTFLIEDFFHLPPVSTTPVVHLGCEYLRECSKKFGTALMLYS